MGLSYVGVTGKFKSNLFISTYATAFCLFVNVRNRDAMLSQNDPSSSCFSFCIPSRRANKASSTSSACCFFLFLDFDLD